MNENVYTRLRGFLDTLPAGYPETPTGVEIKILKKLFTPDEAELTMKLSKDPESVHAIAQRTGISEDELAEKLEEMAQKGLIFRVRVGHDRYYQAFQFVVGIYEFQLKSIDKEFSELFEEYFPYLGLEMARSKTPQLRVIPVESAVGTGKTVEPYNQIRELVKAQSVLSVSHCICRKEQGLLGNPCDKPSETCIGFGDMAQYFIDNKSARQIDVSECLELLDKAEDTGLVLQPTNAKELQWICCCCSCCCPGLKVAKTISRPQKMLHSYYEAKIDPDECTACGECTERCPMDAIQEGDDASEIIEGRCIGCGLCVSTCPVEAITLIPKPGMEAPPKDYSEVLERISADRGIV